MKLPLEVVAQVCLHLDLNSTLRNAAIALGGAVAQYLLADIQFAKAHLRLKLHPSETHCAHCAIQLQEWSRLPGTYKTVLLAQAFESNDAIALYFWKVGPRLAETIVQSADAAGLMQSREAWNRVMLWGARGRHFHLVESLLTRFADDRAGSDPHVVDEVFRAATLDGALEVVKILVRVWEVDPSGEGNLAVYVAASCGHTELVAFLLQNKQVNAADQGNRAVKAAITHGHNEVASLLRKEACVGIWGFVYAYLSNQLSPVTESWRIVLNTSVFTIFPF